jgi:hypothetical protein
MSILQGSVSLQYVRIAPALHGSASAVASEPVQQHPVERPRRTSADVGPAVPSAVERDDPAPARSNGVTRIG